MSKMSPVIPQKCNAGPGRVEEALYLGLKHLGLIIICVFVRKSTSLRIYKRKKRKGRGYWLMQSSLFFKDFCHNELFNICKDTT